MVSTGGTGAFAGPVKRLASASKLQGAIGTVGWLANEQMHLQMDIPQYRVAVNAQFPSPLETMELGELLRSGRR